jgi:transposase-like protein
MRSEGEIVDFIQRRARDLEEEGVTVREMAKRLGVDRTTIYRWREKGLI